MSLIPFLFGDNPIEAWPAASGQATGEPWDRFDRARTALAGGHQAEAVRLWRSIAAESGIESRHVLQAWTFLRGVGITPEPEHAKSVLGAVICVPVNDGHDYLAAYRDGTVRYVNFTGAAVVLDAAPEPVARPAAELLHRSRDLVVQIGPWSEPALPPLPAGLTRLTILTPSGPHFGQGPFDALRTDAKARPFMDAAVTLLKAVVQVGQ